MRPGHIRTAPSQRAQDAEGNPRFHSSRFQLSTRKSLNVEMSSWVSVICASNFPLVSEEFVVIFVLETLAEGSEDRQQSSPLGFFPGGVRRRFGVIREVKHPSICWYLL